MPKYSFEFKKKVVEAYLRGEGGYSYLAKKYGVKNKRRIRQITRLPEKVSPPDRGGEA